MFNVRPAISTEISQILQIDSSAHADRSRQAIIESAVARCECLVAVDNGTLVGYAVMDHGFFGRALLRLIYVAPAHRRRKAASILFDELERRCLSSRIFVSANLSNVPMHRLLSSRGYVLSGMVQDLDEGDPELFYSKKLR